MKDIGISTTTHNKLVLIHDSSDNKLLDFSSPEFELRALNNRPDLETKLASYITHLIHFDFNQLVQILYRLDIDEKKLKTLLGDHKQVDSARMIASLIIDRQLQKLHSRQQNKGSDQIPDDEKW